MKEKCRESEIKNHFIKGEYDFMKYGPIKQINKVKRAKKIKY